MSPGRRRPGALAVLVVVTVLVGVVAGAIGATVQWSTARDGLRSEIADRNLALAVELADRLDARVQGQIALLEVIATRRPIAEFADSATAEMSGVLGASTTFVELFLHDSSGRPVAAAASGYLASPDEVAPRPDLAGLERGEAVVRIVDGSLPNLEIAVPVEDPPGVANGVLVGRLPLDVAGQPILRLADRRSVNRFAVDRTGVVILHRDAEQILERRAVDLEHLLGPDAEVGEVDLDGTAHIVAAAPTELLDAHTVITQSRDAALAPVADQLRALTTILLVVIAAMAIAVVAAAAWLLAPLTPLVSAVRSLGRDVDGVRVDERGVGDIAAVAREFNRLASTLDDRRRQVDELQRLSILVGGQAHRRDVAEQATDGAARLTEASWVAFCELSDDASPVVQATHGVVDDGLALELAAAVRRSGRTERAAHGGRSAAAVPIRSMEQRVETVLVVGRDDEPVTSDDVEVLETYVAFAGVALDNVARLNLQRELASELASAVEHRRHLLGSVSHELRTPLACIDGFSSILLDRWDELDAAERLDLLRRIRQHGQDLDELVSGLLDFALVERGALDAVVDVVGLSPLVESVVDAAAPLLTGRDVTVEVPDVEVLADPVMLRRALTNLISNAVKYSASHAPVDVTARLDGDHVRLEVADRGIGLTADEAAAAFAPFWRSTRGDARGVRGSGLGLALVAEYVRSMGGSVGVVSEPGHGSTFFVVLRVADGTGPVETDGESPAG